jgi:hypothetical protein
VIPGPTRLPWPRLIVSALIGVVAAIALIVPPNLKSPYGVVALAAPGAKGPSAAVFHHDFPDLKLPTGIGADGQMFYALAREPMHLRDAAHQLDRPRYRAQRILIPVLVWALHPSGGGKGLVVALVLVNIIGLFIGALATGALSSTLGGSPLLALFFPVLPGALMCLNLATPDAFALALALAAAAFDLRERRRTAIVVAVAAVLAKESLLVLIVGYAIWRGGRRGARFAIVPAAVAGAWWLYLRITLAGTGNQSVEFNPGRGIVRALGFWVHGNQMSMLSVLGGLILGALALRRGGWRNPFGPAVALEMLFVLMLSAEVLVHDYNGTRAALPLLVTAILSLVASAGRGAPADAGDVPSSPREVLVSAR